MEVNSLTVSPRIVRNTQANTLLIKDSPGVKAFFALVAGVPSTLAGFVMLSFIKQKIANLNSWSEWQAALPLLFVYTITLAVLFAFAGIILFSSDSTLIDGQKLIVLQKKVRFFRKKLTRIPSAEMSTVTVGWEDISSESAEALYFTGRVSIRSRKGEPVDILHDGNWANAKLLGREIATLLRLEIVVDELSYDVRK